MADINEEITSINNVSQDVWIFGYGSLMWKPDFEFTDKKIGYIKGWRRRFWQGSTDHRGVPSRPGRVVTLIPSSDGEVWGVAYKVAESHITNVINYLDYREKGGYEKSNVIVEPFKINALLYVAVPGNPDWLGPADIAELAQQIVVCKGPSGTNREYLFKLAETIRLLGFKDPHIEDLEKRVQLLLAEKVNEEEN